MVQSLFPYPGGKYKLSSWIIDHIPEHECYVEPFGGGAAVLLNKPKSNVEVYNDIDSNVVTFFRVLRDSRDELLEWLRHTPYSREIHGDMREKMYHSDAEMDDIERAGTFFYLQRSSFGGNRDDVLCYPQREPDGSWRNFTQSYSRGIDRLTEFGDRLSDCMIESSDYTELMDRYDEPDTFFYCDPPYLGSEEKYVDGFDHQELRRTLESLDGEWLLSYGTIPDGYDDYRIEKQEYHYSISSGTESTEKLIMNYDPDETKHSSAKSASEVNW